MLFDLALAKRLQESIPQTRNRRKRIIIYKMIEATGKGYYNPLTSKLPHHQKRLVSDLKLAGLKDFAKEVEDGEFNPRSDTDTQEFWKTPENNIPNHSANLAGNEEGVDSRVNVYEDGGRNN